MPVTTKIEAQCKFVVGPEDSTLNALFTRFDTWRAKGVLRVSRGSTLVFYLNLLCGSFADNSRL
jgi:hypothetical protein